MTLDHLSERLAAGSFPDHRSDEKDHKGDRKKEGKPPQTTKNGQFKNKRF